MRQLADRVVILVEGRLAAELSRPELESRLARRGTLRLELDRCPPELLACVETLAAAPRWDGRFLSVRGSPEERGRVVEAVRGAGIALHALASTEGGLEALYREVRVGVMSRAALLAVVGALACSRGALPPSAVDTRSDAYATCRMLVSDPRPAAQLVAWGEEPLFFDDVGGPRRVPPGAPAAPRGGGLRRRSPHQSLGPGERGFLPAPAAGFDAHGLARRRIPGSELAGRDPRAKGGRLGLCTFLPSGLGSGVLIVSVLVNPASALRTAELLLLEGTAAFAAASLALLRHPRPARGGYRPRVEPRVLARAPRAGGDAPAPWSRL